MSGKRKPTELSLINVTLNREEVEQLIKGLRCTIEQNVEFTKMEFKEFCGNQHNEEWRWRFDELKKVYPTTDVLWGFYLNNKHPNPHEKT